LDKKTELGIFVGYNSNSKAYRINLPQTNKVIVHKDVKFLELGKWQEAWILKENKDVRDEHTKGARSLYNIYYNCNVIVMELARYDKAAVNHKWIAAMKEELKIFEKN